MIVSWTLESSIIRILVILMAISQIMANNERKSHYKKTKPEKGPKMKRTHTGPDLCEILLAEQTSVKMFTLQPKCGGISLLVIEDHIFYEYAFHIEEFLRHKKIVLTEARKQAEMNWKESWLYNSK